MLPCPQPRTHTNTFPPCQTHHWLLFFLMILLRASLAPSTVFLHKYLLMFTDFSHMVLSCFLVRKIGVWSGKQFVSAASLGENGLGRKTEFCGL